MSVAGSNPDVIGRGWRDVSMVTRTAVLGRPGGVPIWMAAQVDVAIQRVARIGVDRNRLRERGAIELQAHGVDAR